MENPYTEEWLTDFMDFDNQGQNAQGFQPARHLAPAQEQVMQTESKIPEDQSGGERLIVLEALVKWIIEKLTKMEGQLNDIQAGIASQRSLQKDRIGRDGTTTGRDTHSESEYSDETASTEEEDVFEEMPPLDKYL